jgi:2-polyprenyl-3-methyl-5-hydroxy-6-metoxy-1,4-benzoquinol methylase
MAALRYRRFVMTASTYDDIAEWDDEFVGAGRLSHDALYTTVLALAGHVAGLRLCDLGCGQGRVARHLASLGAHVVGIDLSGRLLSIARRHERASPGGVAYVQDDAQGLTGVRDGVFDGVVSHLALMDIPELAATIQAVRRVLRPGGWLVFSILHPCYQTVASGETAAADGTLRRSVAGYFVEGFWRSDQRPGPPGRVGSHHRTLSTYLNTLTEAALAIDRVEEPRATGDLAARRPVWREVPAFLVVRAVTAR